MFQRLKNMNSLLSGKHVTVAGSTGFIGTNLVERLVQENAIVRALTHKKEIQVINPKVEYMNVDLMRYEDCMKATSNTDIFIMAAAKSSGAGVMAKNPLAHLTPNIVMNSLTLDACFKNKVKKYCFISSNSVYPLSDKSVVESDATGEFFEAYKVVGEMKLFSERMVEMYVSNSKGAMAGIVLRPGNLYGPFDKFSKEESKVIAALIRRAVEQESPFVVWGDGKDIKDFLYISDFIDTIIKVLSLDNNYVTLNIASGKSVDLRKVIDEIFLATNLSGVPIEFDESKPSMIPKRLINIDLAMNLLSWSPKVSLTEGIQRTVEWFRSTQGTENKK